MGFGFMFTISRCSSKSNDSPLQITRVQQGAGQVELCVREVGLDGQGLAIGLKRLKKKPSRTTTFPPVRRLTVWVLYPRYPPVQPTNEPNSAS